MNSDYADIRTLKDFKDYIKKISISIVGIARSNIALLDFLRKCGVKKITARDKKNIFSDGDIQELKKLEKTVEINYILGENYLDDLNEDIIFKTPAIRRDLPQFANAVKNGSILTSEIELFFAICPCKTIAITGSEGKTTTTTIIGEILKTAGKTTYVGGNIGSPLLNQIENIKKDDYAILELSSFQLFDLDNGRFKPNYSVITNITPNHLDWHKNINEYIGSKKIIFKNQNESDKIILSYDNDITKNFISDINFFFSKNKLPDDYPNGIYCDNDNIIIRENGEEKIILNKRDIFIRGEHNVWNFMAAIGVTYNIVNSDVILNTAKTFKGVEHRIEFTRKLNGVSYYNSSIDSTPTRTIAALNYFDEDKKIIIILGGYDKKIPFEPLAPAVYKKVKAAVLYGATKDKIKKCLDDYKKNNNCADIKIYISDHFDLAVKQAKELSGCGDIVLLSPACASMDCFKDFEERGNRFKELVKNFY